MNAPRDFDTAELFDSLGWNRSVITRKPKGSSYNSASAVVTQRLAS